MVDISQQDYQRFFVAKPDDGFSATRNKTIIEQTIRDTEENYKRRRAEFEDNLGERVEVVSGYIKHLVQDHASTSFEQYAGKEYIARLRGERKLAKIKNMAQQRGYLV